MVPVRPNNCEARHLQTKTPHTTSHLSIYNASLEQWNEPQCAAHGPLLTLSIRHPA